MSKILLVDNEGSVLHSIETLLLSAGHEVIPICNSIEAAEKLKTEEYDLLVTDLRMPDVDGLQLVKQANSRKPPIPSIIISAYGSDTVEQESRMFGCTAYIQKPFKIQAVLDAVQSALSQKKT